MTVRILHFAPNDIVAYPADGTNYTYMYYCASCQVTFIADTPQLTCPIDNSPGIVQKFSPEFPGNGFDLPTVGLELAQVAIESMAVEVSEPTPTPTIDMGTVTPIDPGLLKNNEL